MIVKVCGMREPANLIELGMLEVDMIGFNFYPESKRYISESLDVSAVGQHRVGVFVNETLEKLAEIVEAYDLSFVQLHGDEDLAYCKAANELVHVIKVFRVSEDFDFSVTKAFEEYAVMFLFDTYTEDFGGSGRKFNWKKLDEYTGDTAFLLSGGIGPKDAKRLWKIEHKEFLGIDINSAFEISPGVKDIELIAPFLDKIRKLESE